MRKMDGREIAGVRRAITWLHEEAKRMNDTHARQVLNNAAFHLGNDLSRWSGRGRWGEHPMNAAGAKTVPSMSPHGTGS